MPWCKHILHIHYGSTAVFLEPHIFNGLRVGVGSISSHFASVSSLPHPKEDQQLDYKNGRKIKARAGDEITCKSKL